MRCVDLNCDLGESFGSWRMGDDAAMLDLVSSASVACGFHAGDPAGILRVLKAAAARGVAVGAHVSYPDLVGFGRRDMELSAEELSADVIYQIGALEALARVAGARISHVKPHGALYNRMARDPVTAGVVIGAVKAAGPGLALLAPSGLPVVAQARAAGLQVVSEVFADRGYNADATLADRRLPGALIEDPGEVAARMLALLDSGSIAAIDGTPLPLEAQTICLHGDTPSAVALARALRAALSGAGWQIAGFSRGAG